MFSLQKLLQEGLDSVVTLKPEPRNEIWVSDVGKPFIDRFLNMKGTPYSNPSDGSSLQNFIIGSGIEKAYIDQVKLCMIPEIETKKIRIEIPGCLPVSGRSDLLLNVSSWQEVKDRIDKYLEDAEIPELRKIKKLRLLKLVENWEKKYPTGIPKSVYEIKSINSWALKYHKTDEALLAAYPHYVMQLVGYMIGHKLTEGGLIFIAKDAGKNYGHIKEIQVKLTPELEKKFIDDVKQFSQYFLTNTQPPIEPLLINGKLNWKVRYSAYYNQIYKTEVDKLNFEDAKKSLPKLKKEIKDLKQGLKDVKEMVK